MNINKNDCNSANPCFSPHFRPSNLHAPVQLLRTFSSTVHYPHPDDDSCLRCLHLAQHSVPHSLLVLQRLPRYVSFYANSRYEAYILYIFLCLLIHYMGGEQAIVWHFEANRFTNHPWPLENTLSPIRTDRQFFISLKKSVLQFVFVKPVSAVLSILFALRGNYHEGSLSLTSPYIYLAVINNVSISLSLYGLVLFYMTTEDKLSPFRPLLKFLCIKAIIFFSYWQGCLIIFI